jgi:hypothetical protein
VAYYNQEERETAQPIETVKPPDGYPISRYVYRLPGTRWRPVHGFLRRNLSGVAYDLVYRGAAATLYVMPQQSPSLPNAPPQRIGAATGNRALAAWQEGDLLYVLVVEGDERTYQSFVRRTAVG